jgi:amino acid transporter
MVLVLIILALIVFFGWINVLSVRWMRSHHANTYWWCALITAWVVGIIVGVWGGFFFEYHTSPDFRVAGAPIPAVLFHLEDDAYGKPEWVDFPAGTPLLNATSNVVLVPLLFAVPISFIFWASHRKSHIAQHPR